MPLHFFPFAVIMMPLLRITKKILAVSVILTIFVSSCWASMFDIFDETDYAVYFPLGEWRLGMSSNDIRELPSVPVLAQGLEPGILEASGIQFLGRDTRISYVFNEDVLTYSQLWLYEGSDKKTATSVWLDLFDHLNKQLGGVTIPNASIKGIASRKDVKFLLEDLLKTSKQVVSKINARSQTKASYLTFLDMIPKKQPSKNRIHAQLMYNGIYDNYFVVLFEDDHDMPSRMAQNNITLIPMDSEAENVAVRI